MSWITRVALVVALLGALVFAGVASASTGTAKGIELPQGAAFPQAQHCNIVTGEITFSAPGESFPVFIVVRLPSSMFPVSSVCLDPNDLSVHTVFLNLLNFEALAIGSISGTSTEAGASGVFLDQFNFSLSL
jgi:hypothetical protein